MATAVSENTLESNSYDRMQQVLAAQGAPVPHQPAIVLKPQPVAPRSSFSATRQVRFCFKTTPDLRSDSWRSTPQVSEDSGSEEAPLFSSPSSSPVDLSVRSLIDECCDAEVAYICGMPFSPR
jgi:hypothetical protein